MLFIRLLSLTSREAASGSKRSIQLNEETHKNGNNKRLQSDLRLSKITIAVYMSMPNMQWPESDSFFYKLLNFWYLLCSKPRDCCVHYDFI